MSELSIKITIAGRTYPLTINRDEEEIIRRTADKINHNIKELQQNYAVKDIQDLLAMTALQLASESGNPKAEITLDKVHQDIRDLNQNLIEFLSE